MGYVVEPASGKRRATQGRTRDEAVRRREVALAKAVDARPTSTRFTPLTTVGELAAWWLDNVAVDQVRPSSLDKYRGRVAHLGALARVPLQEVSREGLIEWQRSLLGTLAPGTVADARTTVRQVFAHAVRSGLLAANPLNDVKPPAVHRQPGHFLNSEQVAALVAVTDKRGAVARILFSSAPVAEGASDIDGSVASDRAVEFGEEFGECAEAHVILRSLARRAKSVCDLIAELSGRVGRCHVDGARAVVMLVESCLVVHEDDQMLQGFTARFGQLAVAGELTNMLSCPWIEVDVPVARAGVVAVEVPDGGVGGQFDDGVGKVVPVGALLGIGGLWAEGAFERCGGPRSSGVVGGGEVDGDVSGEVVPPCGEVGGCWADWQGVSNAGGWVVSGLAADGVGGVPTPTVLHHLVQNRSANRS